MKQLEEER